MGEGAHEAKHTPGRLRAARLILRRLRRAERRSEGGAVVGIPADDEIVASAAAWAAERARESDAGATPPVKPIAFYLPQFHPIPENNLWWGAGFTEWTSVVRARPLFRGHYQPQLSTELGFYDLRVPEVLERQAVLAREHGIFGFCFYYYWFDGRRVLERPLDHLLASGRPDLPFCFCWANENWTRAWDGLDDDVLLRQSYDGGWAERLIRDLLPALADTRYVRVRGAPLLLVYRVDGLPDAPRAAETWREVARRELGVDLHLAAVQSFGIGDPRPYGFDAAVEFPPHPFRFPPTRTKVRGLDAEFAGSVVDYEAVARESLARPLPEYPWYRGVMPSWDNTARRGRNAFVVVGSTPAVYQTWLAKAALQTLAKGAAQEPFVFLNAWNEWAEGTHLEPDDRHGRGWLEATRAALDHATGAHASSGTVPHAAAV